MIEEGRLGPELEALEGSLSGAANMAAAFDAELRRIHQTFSATGGGVARLEASLSRGLGRAIDGVVLDGMRLSDALKVVANSMISTAYRAAVQPVTQHFGGMIAGGLAGLFGPMDGFAKGGAFSQGRVMPFARGGVVTGPTAFPMRGGTGLMGEAGPEAILPLARGADGRLGVRAAGGGGAVTVVMNICRGFRNRRPRSRPRWAGRWGAGSATARRAR